MLSQFKKQAESLLEKYGSPLFVVEEKAIRQKHYELHSALKSHYPKSKIAYSYKTNYLLAICRIVKNLGMLAEVVSGLEYEIAKGIGVRGSDIVFNGPYKLDVDLERAARDKCLINIDNHEELIRLKKIAENLKSPIRVGIRVFSESASVLYKTWSRFGFCLEDGEAEQIFNEIFSSRGLIAISGLHAHIGTNIAHPKMYHDLTNRLGKFCQAMNAKFGFVPDYIDIGGGFAVQNNKPINTPVWQVPPIEAYVEEIAAAMHKYFPGGKPLLIVEPGRYMVADALTLFTTVLAVKYKNGAQQALVDGSLSLLPLAGLIAYPVRAASNSGQITTTLFGLSCMQTDILNKGELPHLKSGDFLSIQSVGAYSISRASTWIAPKPAVILVKENGDIAIARRRENTNDATFLDALE